MKSFARRVRFVFAALLLVLVARAFADSKAPVDIASEARLKAFFAIKGGDYAVPPVISSIMRQWFPPGTPRKKIEERLAQGAELKASWESPAPGTRLWVVPYSRSNEWDGSKWATNCFCMEFTFKFDKDGGLETIAGRWIMFTL